MSGVVWPKNIAFTLERNPHKLNYDEIVEYLADCNFDNEDWVSTEQKAKALETDELWELRWYPNTPVGHCVRLAADFESLVGWMARSTE